jgi:hypothetical protein
VATCGCQSFSDKIDVLVSGVELPTAYVEAAGDSVPDISARRPDKLEKVHIQKRPMSKAM